MISIVTQTPMNAFISLRLVIGLHGDLSSSGLSALFLSAFLFVISLRNSNNALRRNSGTVLFGLF